MSVPPDQPTALNPTPPAVPPPGAPPPPAPSSGVGFGMLLTIVVLAVAAAVLGVLVVTHHHHGAKAAAAQQATVLGTNHRVRRQATTTTQSQTTTAATTTAATTTAATTTQPQAAAVPSVSGDLASAVEAVHNAGFSASVHYVPSDQPRGTVVAQSPAGGSSAPSGSQVTINVSAGPSAGSSGAAATVTVPNTVGMTIPQAVSTVNAAGLHLVMLKRYVTDQSQAGQVVAQTPSAGSQAPKNSRVLVYMGAFKQ